MKKRLFCLIFSLLCLLSLSACSAILDIRTDIHKNGSGTVSFMTGADRELYESLTEMDSSFSTELKELPYNGETVFGTVLSVDFASPEELIHLLTNADAMNEAFPGLDSDTPLFDSVTVSPKGISGKVNLAFFPKAGGDAVEYGVEITGQLSFTFPGTIKNANGIISEDGRTVSWDISNLEETIFAEVRGSFSIGLAIILFAAAAAVVLLILFRKRKKQKESPAFPSGPEVLDGDIPLQKAPEIPDDVWYTIPTDADTPCPVCGAFNSSGNNYCTACGAKLTQNE